jgi:hypothetical protein
MTERMLQLSFRKGRMFAAYLELGRRTGQKSARTVAMDNGLLVIDYDADGVPMGVEITAPFAVPLQRLNEVLVQLGEPPLSDQESRSLQAA